ncbi:hypothetical protein HF872_10255 [Megasphaera hexanoica]|uniref:CRISPR-associated protein n=1 Tax=Megasphaera hexanoica TaxID=1675036 RepID=A0A848C199_9FIRM|nr:TM1812 family CRISPR-associated protein [Megasphaera hexanoica]NME28997.1 hypothetical protein [Megasphaera hexanoica]
MEHQAMLLFLSDIKANEDGVIRAANYKDGIGPCYTTNESAVRYEVNVRAHGLERLFVFATGKVQGSITYKAADKSIHTYYDAEGKSWTHLAYFINRIASDVHSKVDIESYDENSDIRTNMHSLVGMADRIEQYVQTLPESDTLVLHADCTGGMRHAAMVMMAVIRLMQYNERVRIGDILYSNYQNKKVEKANDIYDLFDMIAGAEEYVRFGSVRTLMDYYQKQGQQLLSPQLQTLLQSMSSFAEAISLCNYGIFQRAITGLRQGMQIFAEHIKQKDNIDLSDSFMNTLYGRIQTEYAPLLQKEKPDDVTLIRWCLKHDYIQQALTLYTERVPEIMGNHHLGMLTVEGKKIFEKQLKKNKNASFNFKLFTLFKDEDSEKARQSQCAQKESAYCKVLRDVLKDMEKKARSDKETDYAQYYLDEIEKILHSWKHTGVDEIIVLTDAGQLYSSLSLVQNLFRRPAETMSKEKDSPILQQMLQLYRDSHDQQVPSRLAETGFKLAKWIPQMKQNDLIEIFSDIDIEVPYSNRFMQTVRNGWVTTPLPEETIRQILDQYGAIKGERNHTNHARQDLRDVTVTSVKERMEKGLATLQQVIAREECR